MRTLVKNAVGRLVSASRLNALLLRRAGVVVAFHRVHDADDRQGLSIGRDMFERHCRFFRRHFNVVPLGELVGRLERGETLNRHLAITFDDGYRDNFENARPVLEKLSLPATFFVVSQWLDSDAWPWWDREQGVRHPWMTWEQVGELARHGFEIGAHTRTHLDLGHVSERVARDEILGSRIELERRLGIRVNLFAYPYGGPQHMSDASRAIVKAAGFRCCCSCYGGLAPAGADPFRLQRIAVSRWFGSPHQFGLEIAREFMAGNTSRGVACCEISEAIGY
jgi:peptidoglycan/xylan/chitin deacetylase (PgdA/CDA1 family)